MNNNSIKDQAVYYLSLIKNGCTYKEKEDFKTWVNENEEHKRIFYELKHMQDSFSNMSTNIKKQMSKEVFEDLKKESKNKVIKNLCIAASIIFCISIGLLQTHKYNNFEIKHTYLTENKIKDIFLPDASHIVLDAKTKVSIKYFDDKRIVNMEEGTALFSVTRNKEKPFYINMKKLNIKVIGTSFEVNNLVNTIEVDVISGIVSINSQTNELIKLTQGQKMIFDKKTNLLVLDKIDPSRIGKWKDGILIFKDTTIKDAFEEFKKYKDIQPFLNDNVQDLTLTGSFKLEEFDKFIFAISQIHSLSSKKKGKKISIFK